MSIERRIVTVVFADLVDFTPLSERLDAEDVALIQDAYFEVVRDTIGRYGGSLEKFIGDAVMAAFGLGHARDDDAERAVRAGLALIHGVESLGARLGLDVDELRIRVGINSGEAVIGASIPAEGQGTELGRVTGDTVNVAARLQAAASPGRVLVGEATALAVEGSIELEPAEAISLKGKAEPVRARLVVAIRPEPSRELAMGGMVAPTIGREQVLDRLLAASDRTSAGAAERILIIAPPGVGKSRVLTELMTRRSASGQVGSAPAWRTRSREERSGPYALVRDVLSAALTEAGSADLTVTPTSADDRLILERRIEGTGASSARAHVIVDAVVQILAPATHPLGHPSDPSDRDGLFAAWSSALAALAGPQPVWWLAEDLHWAGADEVAFIEAVTGHSGWHGLLVIATARPSVLERIDAGWTRLELEPLPGIEARGLLHALVGDSLPDDLTLRILDRADGNPLFIEELLRTWVSAGTLERSGLDGSWQLTAAATEFLLPTTIQAIYAAQLDDLPGDARTTARRASVAGRMFPIEVLPELGTADRAATVGELARRAVVSGPQHDRIVGDTYAYRHALVRDAGYASLARAERAELHLRLAVWLEGVAGLDVDQIAGAIGGHYADALLNASTISATVGLGLAREEVAARAAGWLERAGDSAITAAAYDAARANLRQAVDLTPDVDAQAMGRRLTRLGDSLAGTGSLDDAIDAYGRAVSCIEVALATQPVGGPARDDLGRSVATAARGLAAARFEQTRFAEALAVVDRASTMIGPDDEASRLRLDLVAIEARMALSNDAKSLIPDADRLVDRAQALGDPDILLDTLQTVMSVRSETGDATTEEWRALSERLSARARWTAATRAMLNAIVLTDDDRTFDALAERTASLADAHGQTESQAWLAQRRTGRSFLSGDWDDAIGEALHAIDLGEADGYHRVVVRTWAMLGPIAAARSDRATLERAASWFEARDRENTFPDSPYGRLMHMAVDVDLASVGLRATVVPDLAHLEVAFGLAYNSPDWLVAIERVVGAMLDAGHSDDARAAVDLVGAYGASEREPLADVSAALTRAWVAQAAGDSASATDLARSGLSIDAAARAPWWTSRLLGVLERNGSATAAETEQAREIAAALRLAPANG